MNKGLIKFERLLKTDTEFQEKLKKSMEHYNGAQTEKAVFKEVLVPLGKEYGISATFEEFKEYVHNIPNEDRELSEEEVDLVAGGKTGGLGVSFCIGPGIGVGAGGGDDGFGVCTLVGGGMGGFECVGSGK